MPAKTTSTDALLLRIDNLLGEIFDLQKALKQLGQYGVISQLSGKASQLSSFRGNRGKEDARRLKENEKMQKLIREVEMAIKKADAVIKELEGREQKPVTGKSAKRKTDGIKVNLSYHDGSILKTALTIIEFNKQDWERFRAKPLDFINMCFATAPIFVLRRGQLNHLQYLDEGLFVMALKRIVNHYKDWFESQFVLPTSTRTGKLFKLVQEKVGDPNMLEAMFEVMLGKSLAQLDVVDISRME